MVEQGDATYEDEDWTPMLTLLQVWIMRTPIIISQSSLSFLVHSDHLKKRKRPYLWDCFLRFKLIYYSMVLGIPWMLCACPTKLKPRDFTFFSRASFLEKLLPTTSDYNFCRTMYYQLVISDIKLILGKFIVVHANMHATSCALTRSGMLVPVLTFFTRSSPNGTSMKSPFGISWGISFS